MRTHKRIQQSWNPRKISESPAYVTQRVAPLDFQDPVVDKAFNLERTRDVTVINEVVTAYKAMPEKVAAWVEAADQEITWGLSSCCGTIRANRSHMREKNLLGQKPMEFLQQLRPWGRTGGRFPLSFSISYYFEDKNCLTTGYQASALNLPELGCSILPA